MVMERIPVIRTRNLSIGYVLKGGHLKLVHDALDLNLYPGEVTCLLGLNGAGKRLPALSGGRDRIERKAVGLLLAR
mgnify:CR=1 FL=1